MVDVGFTSKFASEFSPGNSVVIEAVPKNEDAWFCLTLMTKQDYLVDKYDKPDHPIVFALQLRYDGNLAVMNAFDGGWGEEERVPLDVDRSEKLKIKVKGGDDAISVFLNGNHFADFKHRQSLSSITHFNVYGEFTIKKCHVK